MLRRNGPPGMFSLLADGGALASSLAPSAITNHCKEPDVTSFRPRVHEPATRPTLAVYIGENRDSCRVAVEVAERVRREFPHVDVRVIDLGVSSGQRPDGVFVVPTFMLDGEIVSLGTPSWERLMPLLGFAQDGFSQDGLAHDGDGS